MKKYRLILQKITAIPVLQKAFGEEGFDTLADFDQYVDDAKYDERSLEKLKDMVRNILDNEFFPDIEEELISRIVSDLMGTEQRSNLAEKYTGPKKYKKVVGSGKTKRQFVMEPRVILLLQEHQRAIATVLAHMVK